jgi:hypothetical protein
MKLPIFSLLLLTILVCSFSLHAQKRAVSAVVIDERLSLLRVKPSLFANSAQRMRRGRRVQIVGVAEHDGVKFLKVAAPPRFGWMQSEALFSKSRPEDEQRLVRLVNASHGFEQIELATIFFEMYPASTFRPPVLLLYGDLLEEIALKLSRDATSRLSRREMIASGAPVYSYYLNFNSLDRYRRLGVTFLFNPDTRTFHYNGASWNEILRKNAGSSEAIEARKRLDSLKVKLERRSQ